MDYSQTHRHYIEHLSSTMGMWSWLLLRKEKWVARSMAKRKQVR